MIASNEDSVTAVDTECSPCRIDNVMLTIFKKKRAQRVAPIKIPSTPEGVRIYAIGDIHGRHDLLVTLQDRILNDAAEHPQPEMTVVYLGDYVDRGPNSREVLEQLSTQPLPGFTSIHLRGNHEHALLGFMHEPETYSNWLNYGGLATLSSYGVGSDNSDGPRSFRQMARELTVNMPEHHLSFLNRLETHRMLEDYLFVHAGIRPGVSIEAQYTHDLLWIREDFLKFTKPHPYFIVHGHQICDEPEVKNNRIGIDTGAFATGRLCCLVLDGEDRKFIDTR